MEGRGKGHLDGEVALWGEYGESHIQGMWSYTPETLQDYKFKKNHYLLFKLV